MTKPFTLTGVDELNRVFKKLSPRLREKAVLNAVRAGARIVRDEAKRRVPVRTGALRKSIKVVTEKKKFRTVDGLVFVGFKGDAAFRAHFTEFRVRSATIKSGPFKGRVIPARRAQPFLVPAAEAKAEDAIRAITETLGTQTEKQAASLIASEGANRKR